MDNARKLKEYIEEGFGVPTDPEKYSTGKGYDVVIAAGMDTPEEGLNSYSTFGLSRYALNGSKGVMPFRVELLAGSMNTATNYPLLLVNAACYFIDNNSCYRPGSFIEDGALVAGFDSGRLSHLYLSIPQYWKHNFEGVVLSDYEVKFLLTFPISDSELEYLIKYGSDKFENMLEQSQADIFDVGRDVII